MLERDLMKELKGNDSLLNSNDTLLQFYNDSTKLILQKLIEIGDTLSSKSIITDSTMTIINENDSLLRAIEEEIAYSVLLLNDSSLADTANIIIQQLLSQYHTLNDINKNLLVNLKGESINLGTTAWDRNTEIEPSNFNEFIEKKVNDIYLRGIGHGIDSLTLQDKSDLESIIHICPLAGGPAVYRARALYITVNDTIEYHDSLVCRQANFFRESQEQWEQKAEIKIKKDDLNIYLFPNPAQDKLMLLFKGDIDAGKIEIYDLTGAIVATHNLSKSSSNKELDISLMAEGYYLIHFTLGNYYAVKSFIKIK
jgi:hypothetical protein